MEERKSHVLFANTIKSGAGLLLSRILADGLGLARTALLSLFLLPTHFGVVGFSLLLTSTIHYFSNIGLETALIQKKGAIEDYLNSVWTFNVIRGGLISTLLITLSPGIAMLFSVGGTPQEMRALTISIIVISLFSFIRDAQNVGVLILRRSLQFKKIIIGEFLTQIISFSTVIVALFFFQDFIPLLSGLSSMLLSQFIISYAIHPFRPRFTLKIAKVKDLLGFSKWIFLSGFLIFILVQMDDYIVNLTLGVASLGLYQLAYQISCVPATEIANVISHVSFPSFASVQDDISLLKGGLIKNIEVVSLISIPICFLFIFFSKDTVSFFLAPEWNPIIPIFQLLAVWGCIWSLGTSFDWFFNAIGKPDLSTKSLLVQAIVMYTLMVPFLFFFSLVGMCIGIIIAGFITMLIRFIFVKKILKFSWWEATRNIIFLLSLLLLTGVVHVVLDVVFFVEKKIFILVIQLIIDVAVFCVSGLLLERVSSFRFLKMAKEIITTLLPRAFPAPK